MLQQQKDTNQKKYEKINGKIEVALKKEEDWINPAKCVPIACFYKKKYNKSIENDKISNRRDTFREHIEVENSESAEDLEKTRRSKRK